MKYAKVFGVIITMVALVAWLAAGRPLPSAPDQKIADLELTGSGMIQAQQDVVISPEVGGRAIAVDADEGDQVEAGDVLVRLDGALLEAQIGQARAAVEGAEANLARVKAAARPAQVEANQAAVDGAQAQVKAAQAAVDTARANLHAAQAARQAAQARYDRLAAGASPRELELAGLQVDLARDQLWGAQAQRDAKKAGVDVPLSIPLKIGDFDLGPIVVANPVAPREFDVNAAEAQIVQAESGVRLAELQSDKLAAGPRAGDLASLQAQVERAQAAEHTAQVQLEQAEQAVQVAKTQVRQAQAQLALTQAGAKPESVAVAEAQVTQAQAAVAVLEAQREKLTLYTPIAGLVTERTVHEGETVVPGARLFTISRLDTVVLTIYIPEDQIGRVRVGQAADVRVEALPDRTFPGQVVSVASRAEFTPRNLQTKAERVTTVFAVQIRLANPDRLLKPGMAADATLHEGQALNLVSQAVSPSLLLRSYSRGRGTFLPRFALLALSQSVWPGSGTGFRAVSE
jgi:HlyD family secretion protein